MRIVWHGPLTHSKCTPNMPAHPLQPLHFTSLHFTSLHFTSAKKCTFLIGKVSIEQCSGYKGSLVRTRQLPREALVSVLSAGGAAAPTLSRARRTRRHRWAPARARRWRLRWPPHSRPPNRGAWRRGSRSSNSGIHGEAASTAKRSESTWRPFWGRHGPLRGLREASCAGPI